MVQHHLQKQKSTNGRAHLLHRALDGLCRVAPGVAAVLAERLFLTPSATRRPLRETGWAASAKETVMTTDAGDLAVWTWGDGGPTVLLVHGWSGRGLQLGAFAGVLVERGFRVVAHDAPGHGSSPGRTSSLIEIARGAGAVARALGGVDGVIGHSLGATAAILAVGRGELLTRRLATLSPAASLREIVVRFGHMTGFTPEVLDRMRRRLAKRFHFDWSASEPLNIAARTKLPLLVVHDQGDRFIPFNEAVSLATAWPGAGLMTTTGLGHHRLLRDDKVIGRVVDFTTSARAASCAGHDQRLSA